MRVGSQAVGLQMQSGPRTPSLSQRLLISCIWRISWLTRLLVEPCNLIGKNFTPVAQAEVEATLAALPEPLLRPGAGAACDLRAPPRQLRAPGWHQTGHAGPLCRPAVRLRRDRHAALAPADHSLPGEHLGPRRFIAYLEVYVLALIVGGKVLIMDNHPVHCAKAVKRFLERTRCPSLPATLFAPA